MGGFGSGWRRPARLEVEAVRSVDVRRWHREGLLEARDDPDARSVRGWRWHDREGKETASIVFVTRSDSVTFLYASTRGGRTEDVKERVALAWMPLHFGGARPWFVCPMCGQRAAILYLVGSPGCRRCHSLTYRSRNETDTDRAVGQCHKLQELHGGDGGALGGLGMKPKGMHRQTWARIRERHERNRVQALEGISRTLGIGLSRGPRRT